MTPLQESVKHWEENLEKLKAETIDAGDIYSENCPLCTAYVEPEDDCSKCPVAKDTGMNLCQNSPWEKAQLSLSQWFYRKEREDVPEQDFKDSAIAALQAEIDYLKNLADKEAN